MTHCIITRWDGNGRVEKFLPGFASRAAAEAHYATISQSWPGALIAEQPSAPTHHWLVSGSPLALSVSPPPVVISAEQVQAERNRRLALGFDYDFADGRGVHRIGTTPADMEGWREVIDYANALIDLGDTDTQIPVITDTGPAQVTAPEWQAVMLRAAQVRQVVWAKSFELQAMSPIPEDYRDDAYWAP